MSLTLEQPAAERTPTPRSFVDFSLSLAINQPAMLRVAWSSRTASKQSTALLAGMANRRKTRSTS